MESNLFHDVPYNDLATMYKIVHGFDDTTGIFEFRVNSCTRAVSYTHLTLPTNREV